MGRAHSGQSFSFSFSLSGFERRLGKIEERWLRKSRTKDDHDQL
jgi:hypothetical protein